MKSKMNAVKIYDIQSDKVEMRCCYLKALQKLHFSNNVLIKFLKIDGYQYMRMNLSTISLSTRLRKIRFSTRISLYNYCLIYFF